MRHLIGVLGGSALALLPASQAMPGGVLTPAPEPATLALLGAGLLGAFGARKRGPE